MSYCFTFLCCGRRHNKSLLNKLERNPIFRGKNLVITSDEPHQFEKHGNTFNISSDFMLKGVGQKTKRNWFNFNLKREAIRNAAELGYNKIFYVDSDIEMSKWDEDFFIKEKRGAFFRRFIMRSQHAVKYNFYDKIFRLGNWRMYRPVSEKIMYFNESLDKIKMFTETWEQLDLISRGKINPPTEGHEIRISCKMNDIDVHTFKPDPFKKEGGNIFTDRVFE